MKSVVYFITPHLNFILAFDVNDEIFQEIMLPRNYFDGAEPRFERLVVFKGSLALFAYGDALDEGVTITKYHSYG